MSDFSKLEGRLDKALAVLSGGGAASENQAKTINDLKKQISGLQAEATKSETTLEKARTRANAHRDAHAALKNEVDAANTAFQTQISGLTDAQEDAILQRDKAREFSKSLKTTIVDLRKANEDMVGNPSLINKTLEEEMLQLKKQHAADMEEVNSILARLTPLVEGN